MKKKIIIGCGTIFLIVFIVFICFIMWFANMIDNSLSKKEIIELVNENYSIILNDVNEKEFSDTERIEGIQEIYNKKNTLTLSYIQNKNDLLTSRFKINSNNQVKINLVEAMRIALMSENANP